jgi:hypothetical protein
MALFSTKSLRDTDRNLAGHGSLENVSAFQKQKRASVETSGGARLITVGAVHPKKSKFSS